MGGANNQQEEQLDYQAAYDAYWAAQKKLYESRMRRQEISGNLDEDEKRGRAAKEAEAFFKQRGETQRELGNNIENWILTEKTAMQGVVDSKMDISKEEYFQRTPLIPSLEELRKLRRTEPERYNSFMDILRGLNRKPIGAAAEAGKGKEVSVKEYETLSQDLEDLEATQVAKVEKRERELLGSESVKSTKELENELNALKREQDRLKEAEKLSLKLTAAEQFERFDQELNLRESVGDFFKEEKDLEKQQAAYRSLEDKFGHFSFTDLWRKDKEDERRRETEAALDQMLQDYQPKENGQKPVNSLADYEEAIRKERELGNRLKQWEKERPEKLEDILKHGKEWGDPQIDSGLAEYEKARKQWAKLRTAGEKLPETFTELGKMERDENKRERYQATVGMIDSIISDHKGEAIVGSLQEYFNMKKAPRGRTPRDSEEVRAAEAKEQIKKWIVDHNKKIGAEKPREEDLKRAEKGVAEAGKGLVEAVQNYNAARKTEKNDLKTQHEKQKADCEAKKRFIKDTVIKEALAQGRAAAIGQENLHAERKGKMAAAIGNHYQGKASALDERIKEAEQAYKNAQDTVQEALKKKNLQETGNKWKEDDEKYNKRRKRLESAVGYQTIGLEEIIRKENEKIRKNNEAIGGLEENMGYRFDDDEYNKHVSDRIKAYREDKLAGSKKDYVRAASKERVIGLANRTLEMFNKKFRDMIAAASEAAIRGEVEEVKQQQQETSRKRENAVSGQRYAFKSGLSLEEGLRAQLEPGGNPEQEARPVRAQITLNQLSKREEQIRADVKHSREHYEQLIRLNQKRSDLEENLQDRIMENRASIDETLKGQSAFDAEGQKRFTDMVYGIMRETAGDDVVLQQKAEGERQKGDQELETAIRSEEKVAERLDAIEKWSSNLAPLFTEKNLNRIDKLVVVGEKIANFLINRANEAAGNPSTIGPIDVDGKLSEIRETMTAQEEPREHTLTQIVEIGKLVYQRFSDAGKQLDEQYQEAVYELDNAKNRYEGVKKEEKEFKEFCETTPEIQESNRLEQWMAYLDRDKESLTRRIDDDVAMTRRHEEMAAGYKQEAASSAQTHREELEGQDRQIAADKELRSAQKKEMQTAFARTVQAAVEQGGRENGMVSLAKEAILGPELETVNTPVRNAPQTAAERAAEARNAAAEKNANYAFLSALTGTEMKEGMDLNTAMEAFGRIHINGINAVSYFNLAERWKTASFGGPESQQEQSKLVEGLSYYGGYIREALKDAYGALPQEKLTGTTRQLAGQIIAVEDKDTKLLSAVKLEGGADNKKLQTYNSNVRRMTEDFNAARVEVARAELGMSARTRDSKLAQAVHRSRNVTRDFRAKAEKSAMRR